MTAKKSEIQEEANRLMELLQTEDLPRLVLASGFKDFSEASKNEVASRVAQTFNPPPPGRVIARLSMIMTEKNKNDITNAYLANLRSPDPEARKYSLYGLDQLGHPSIADFAMFSLRDDNDQVLIAACDVLIPKARQDRHLWNLMKNFYASYRDNKEYYGIITLLEAHHIEKAKPD